MLVFTLAALSVARVNDNRAAFRTVRFLLERRVNLQPVRPELVEACPERLQGSRRGAFFLSASEGRTVLRQAQHERSEEHTSELQSLMRISYAVFCLKKKKQKSQKR